MAAMMESDTVKIDDDIVSMAKQIFETSIDSSDEEEERKKFQDKICYFLQEERNKWKERVQNSLQEIDKKHRIILATRSSLQELVNSVYPPIQHPDSTDIRQQSASDLITKIQLYIRETKPTIDGILPQNILMNELSILREELSRLNQENSDHLETILSQNKEIHWLQRELVSVKHKLERVRGIMKNYNEARSSSFHLDDVIPHEILEQESDQWNITSERTYHEGDQTLADTTPREAFSIMRLRDKQLNNGLSGKDGVMPKINNNRNGIGKCLRCQTLFRSSENNNMSCRFHRKGREITECYNNQGKLLRVIYKWACCKKALNTAGCAHGCHI